MIGTKAFAAALAGCLALTGCNAQSPQDPLGFGPEPTTKQYTRPGASGLVAVRPYPQANDVCQVIGESAATQDLLEDATLLIGCPKHETGAIAARLRDGAEVKAHARHWTLLTIAR